MRPNARAPRLNRTRSISPELSAETFARRAAWEEVRRRIDAATAEASRVSGAVTLTAVSKQQPWPAVAAILACGQRVFGENRVQEARTRWLETRDVDRDSVELRLIGPLQTNKAADAIATFDVIETLDRDRLGRALAQAVQRLGRAPRIYVQVNTGEEPQKAGVLPSEADALIARARGEFDLPVEGLMCIPPQAEPAGPHFALLARVARRNGLVSLSMGMSDDFEVAIAFGATAVRVGSAVFGARSDQARLSTEAPAASPASRP